MQSSDVLIFSYEFPPDDGGVARYSHGLAKGLSNLGKKVTVLAPGYREMDKDLRDNFVILRIPNTGLFFLNHLISFLFFIRILYRYKITSVIATEIAAERVAVIARLFIPFRFIAVFHGYEILVSVQSPGFWGGLKKAVFYFIVRRAYCVVGVSRYVKSLLVRASVPKKKISIISGGVDTERFSSPGDPDGLRKRLNLNGKRIILTLARLDSVKGHCMVIKALKRAIKEVPELMYIIAGKGTGRGEIERFVQKNGLSDYVLFLGFIPEEDLVSLYKMCDLFVMPSQRAGKGVEGFGLAFLEANMCGKPVIGGRHGGVVDAIIDRETGILVNPHNEKELSDRILELLNNSRFSSHLGEQGRKRCIEFFDWKNVAARFLDCIEKSDFS